MFDWLGDFFNGIGDAIGGAFNGVGSAISEAIWEAMLQWYYETIYNAIADFFTLMGNMGAGNHKSVRAFRVGTVCNRNYCGGFRCCNRVSEWQSEH